MKNLADQLNKDMDEWDDFIQDNPDEGIKITLAARNIVLKVGNEIEPLIITGITIEAYGIGDGGVDFIIDNADYTRRLVFEIIYHGYVSSVRLISMDKVRKVREHTEIIKNSATRMLAYYVDYWLKIV